MSALWVCLGAALGAGTRYLVALRLAPPDDRAPLSDRPPLATTLVNVAGSLVLGVLLGIGTDHTVPRDLALALGVGFCGALTTWSTLSHEVLTVGRTHGTRVAVRHLGASTAAGLAAAALGFALARALT